MHSMALFLVQVAVLQLLLTYSLAQIVIVEPSSLIDALGDSIISGSTAAFGTPYYGDRFLGQVELFDLPGCSQDEYILSNNGDQPNLSCIVAVRRGECNFITKVAVAEAKGATALIIIDEKGSNTTFEDVEPIIMSAEVGKVRVTIPSILIGDVEGSAMIDTVGRGEQVIVELNWDFPKLSYVTMDLWITAALTDNLKFLEEFADYALILKQKISFIPRYWIVSLPENYADKCTDNEGHYCQLNADWDPTVTGQQILQETVREECLWKTTKQFILHEQRALYYSEKWWLYMKRLRETCTKRKNGKSVFGDECSYNLMKEIGVDLNKVKSCYENDFSMILKQELLNLAWSPSALIINGWRYSGTLAPDTVATAVCISFLTTPEECKEIEKIQTDMSNKAKGKDAIGVWTVIFISFVATLFGICICSLLFWKYVYPRIRSSMRYAVMEEVHKEVLTQQNTKVHGVRNLGANRNTAT